MSLIALDFDGTVVEHTYPTVGKEVPGAVSVLQELLAKGHQLILYTMRSDSYLGDAVNWFKEHGIELYGIQKDPEQITWTNSTKCHAQICIDDRNLCTPLIYPAAIGDRPYIDWVEIRKELVKQGIL